MPRGKRSLIAKTIKKPINNVTNSLGDFPICILETIQNYSCINKIRLNLSLLWGSIQKKVVYPFLLNNAKSTMP